MESHSVLRCRYFLRLWKLFLWAAGYTEKYCISREGQDIIEKLIDRLLALIYVYCDHYVYTKANTPSIKSYGSMLLNLVNMFSPSVINSSNFKDLTHLNFLFMIHILVHQQIVESPATNCNFGKRVVTGYQPCNSSAEDYNELYRIVIPYQFHNAGSTL